jgi:glycosyltransferase A (GT-A) superfamily protein (DUF2064 family)
VLGTACDTTLQQSNAVLGTACDTTLQQSNAVLGTACDTTLQQSNAVLGTDCHTTLQQSNAVLGTACHTTLQQSNAVLGTACDTTLQQLMLCSVLLVTAWDINRYADEKRPFYLLYEFHLKYGSPFSKQAGRSKVRFPMMSLEFVIDIILPAAL